MQKLEILVALLHLHNINFTEFDTNELKAWLHSIRTVTREIEKEIIFRDRSHMRDEISPVFFSNVN